MRTRASDGSIVVTLDTSLLIDVIYLFCVIISETKVMLSPSQYLTPDRGRGVAGLRDGLGSPRGPAQLFGGQRGPGLLRAELGPEYTSTPGPGPLSSVTSPEFTGIQSPGPSVAQQPLYSPDMVSGQHQGVTWATRAEMALSAPTLWQRCEDLKLTLESCPVKVIISH